jgi:hypothetical protein
MLALRFGEVVQHRVDGCLVVGRHIYLFGRDVLNSSEARYIIESGKPEL